MRNITIIIIIIVITFMLTPAAFAQQATLSLNPSSGTFNKGCVMSVKIELNTGGAQTDGTDAILIYDPTRFSADTSSIQSGTIYTDYPGNNVDSATGKITISGLASVSTPFTGQGTLATINFTVKDTAPTGATQITFDFDPNDKAKTIDSNVVQRGTVADILNSVVNGNYTVGSGASCGSAGGPAGAVTPRGVATPSGGTIDQIVDKTGKGPGTSELTFTLAIVGTVLTVLGILGLALL